MLTKTGDIQSKMEVVVIDKLIQEDHILKKIDKYIDFNFIYELVEDKYFLDNGRPSIDPVVLFKMNFIGYLFGICSERRLVDEIHHNELFFYFLK